MDQLPEAFTQLVNLLDVSPTDPEAWAELADLYIGQGLLDQAVFALEEVLLIQPNAWNIHTTLAEVLYQSSQNLTNPSNLSKVLAESMRRYLRSIELCENYLRGYYGLKLVTAKLLPIIPEAAKSSSRDAPYSDLALPTEGTVQALHELATAKLGEIVRRGTAGEKGWDGYDAAELKAARELLESSTQKIER
jgi:tetratricopeptide (TPR) repeat protein